MSWLFRLIPSRAAIIGTLAAGVAVLLAWARRDARRDIAKDLEQKDIKNAHDIESRVADDRDDPERLRPFEDAGYRD